MTTIILSEIVLFILEKNIHYVLVLSPHTGLTEQLLDRLYEEKLLTEDEEERMKRDGVSTCQLVHIQCIKPQEVVTRTAVVLDKLGLSESVRQMKG